MCYSNNRKSLYYSCVAGKTYGGINSVTVLFNITSPRPGTPEQLENGANHSIKPTDVSDLMYSLLNTTVLTFGLPSTFYHTFWWKASCSGKCNPGLSDVSYYLFVFIAVHL